MAAVRDQAICVRVWDWSETSQTVSLFSREHGAVRAIAKGAKRENSRFSGGLELMTRGEMIAIIKTGEALAVLTAWDLQEAFPVARRSLSAFHAAMTMLDLLNHAVTDHDPHPELFDALLAGLRRLRTPEDDRLVLLAFLWRVLSETGHRPELANDVRAGTTLGSAKSYAFSPRLGGLTRDDGAAADGESGPLWRVRAETVELLRRLSTGTHESPAPATVDRATRLLASYYREVFAVEPPTLKGYLAEVELRRP